MYYFMFWVAVVVASPVLLFVIRYPGFRPRVSPDVAGDQALVAGLAWSLIVLLDMISVTVGWFFVAKYTFSVLSLAKKATVISVPIAVTVLCLGTFPMALVYASVGAALFVLLFPFATLWVLNQCYCRPQ
jgi:hypothetical protein